MLHENTEFIVEKGSNRRNDRRKNDEDIAERMTGGVRIERSAPRQDARAEARDEPPRTGRRRIRDRGRK